MALDDTAAPSGADAGNALPAETQTTETTTPASIEDTIRNAYRAQQSKAPEVEKAETADAEVAEVVEPDKPRTNAAGRLIDEKGRFLKADGTVVATEAEADIAEPAEPEEPAPAETGQFGEAPKSWKKEAKAEWAKIPEPLRAEIHRREEDFHKGIARYKQFADIGTELHKVIEPYGRMIVTAGHTAPALIGDLLNMQKVMTTGQPEERIAMALQILSNTGIKAEDLVQAAQQQPAIDPNVAALRQELQAIKGQLSSQVQMREQADLDDVNSEVEKFGSDSKNEYFKEVALDMSALISQGRASGLQDAYDKAVWANPETRAKLLQKQEQERVRKQAEQAAAARKAAGANVARRGTPPAVTKPGTIDDTIRSEWRRLSGGG